MALCLLSCAFLPLSQCSTGSSGPSFSPSAQGAAADGRSASTARSRSLAPERRPGLGTAFGDAVDAPVKMTSFVRASQKPVALSTLYYNDRDGVDAMTGGHSYSSPRMQDVSGGYVSWGIKSGFRLLPNRGHYSGFGVKSRRYVIAKRGKRYSIVLKNQCKARAEIVLSVDGLDVIDGKEASVKKRGYIVDPGETIEIQGFRTSESSVAEFRFSSVNASYSALKHGKTRNVGVIGLAVYTEKGVSPWTWISSEVKRRGQARAFAEAP